MTDSQPLTLTFPEIRPSDFPLVGGKGVNLVDKRTHPIINRQFTDQDTTSYPDRNGGTKQESLPVDLSHKQTLMDQQILALAALGSRVEDHFRSPQDIEWARAGGQTYQLQTRPIKSLYPIDDPDTPDGSLHVFLGLDHQQGMTRAMTPLSLTSIQELVPSTKFCQLALI